MIFGRAGDVSLLGMLTLEVDGYGNVLKSATVGYGRRRTIRVSSRSSSKAARSTPSARAS